MSEMDLEAPDADAAEQDHDAVPDEPEPTTMRRRSLRAAAGGRTRPTRPSRPA